MNEHTEPTTEQLIRDLRLEACGDDTCMEALAADRLERLEHLEQQVAEHRKVIDAVCQGETPHVADLAIRGSEMFKGQNSKRVVSRTWLVNIAEALEGMKSAQAAREVGKEDDDDQYDYDPVVEQDIP